MIQNLKEKKIIIVGGSSGIGLAVATMAYESGATVILTSREARKANQIAQNIGTTVMGLPLDVDDESAVNVFFRSQHAIDHIYIAAGSTKIGKLQEGDLEESMQPFATRLYGSLHIVRAATPKMNTGGSIVFTGGISTDRPLSGAWVSGLGIAAVEQLARVLVMELPNIRFNAVAPGYTDTAMWDGILGNDKAALLAEVAQSLPVKKIASPQEVASAVLFLMSNPSITGEVIHVDGGGRLV